MMSEHQTLIGVAQAPPPLLCWQAGTPRLWSTTATEIRIVHTVKPRLFHVHLHSCHLLAGWPWECHLTSPASTFIISKITRATSDSHAKGQASRVPFLGAF